MHPRGCGGHWTQPHPRAKRLAVRSASSQQAGAAGPAERGVTGRRPRLAALRRSGTRWRPVRLYLRIHEQQLPGNKGETATPTAAVVLALFAPIAMVHIQRDTTEVYQTTGYRRIIYWFTTRSASTTCGMKRR